MKAFLVTLKSDYDLRTITFIEQVEYDAFLKSVRQISGVHVTDIVERCATNANDAMLSVQEMLVESDD